MRKIFPLDEVLSVSTGYVVAERNVDAMYDLMGHLTGDDGISTLGLVGAAKTCAAELKKQFPALERVANPWWANSDRKIDKEGVRLWVEEQRRIVGADTFNVLGDTVHARDYSFMNR